MQKLRIFIKPIAIEDAFLKEVENIEEGVELLNTVIDYEKFQVNKGMKEEDIIEYGIEEYINEENDWFLWETFDVSIGLYFDNPFEYIQVKNSMNSPLFEDIKNILKVKIRILNNDISYIEMIENEEFWDSVHTLMKKSSIKPPFKNSFEEYSEEWFLVMQKEIVDWLEALALDITK